MSYTTSLEKLMVKNGDGKSELFQEIGPDSFTYSIK